jgi:hypothetical protein
MFPNLTTSDSDFDSMSKEFIKQICLKKYNRPIEEITQQELNDTIASMITSLEIAMSAAIPQENKQEYEKISAPEDIALRFEYAEKVIPNFEEFMLETMKNIFENL